jgi:hypothetical protein
MPDHSAIYRFYALNSEGTLMGSAVRIKCSDDGAAIKHAQNIKGNFVELWQDERRVGRFSIGPLKSPVVLAFG